MKKFLLKISLGIICLFLCLQANSLTRQMEKLDRGAIAIKTTKGVFLSWRLNATDGKDVSFNIYRNGTQVNSTPITGATNYEDTAGNVGDTYKIKSIKNEIETDDYKAISVWEEPFLRIPLNRPPNGTDPDGAAYTYDDPIKASTECSVADLDGDGEYEFIVKWEPSNWKDNSLKGYTGNTYIDAYKLDGTQLWRIDLGKNIRSGPHYTQFMVYDFDGDGLAELVCKTAPGTIDGKGKFVIMGSDDPAADYRNKSSNKGIVMSGPEYLTLFNGVTGAEMHTIAYEPPRGSVNSWGDSYANRSERYLACVAYLNGVTPSVVMCRGYYQRATLAAYNVIDGKLVKQWLHDSPTKGQGAYGEGNHNLSVADVDGDGFDEIIYGACTIDHDGSLLYRTGFGHGDAMHVTKIDPDREGLQVFCVHEETSAAYGYEMRDAKTGQVIFGAKTGFDVGRGVCADIDSRYRGKECWPIKAENDTKPVFDCKGNIISNSRPRVTFRVYWTADLQDELMENNYIYKWNESKNKDYLYKTFETDGAIQNANNRPAISGDIFGDWREEIALLNNDGELMVFTTTEKTNHRLFTLMHDPVYRLGIAWQNVAYNQPPHLSFYIGDGTENVTWPELTTPIANKGLALNKDSLIFTASVGRLSLTSIPLGGLSDEIEWEVANPEIARVIMGNNKKQISVQGIGVGTTSITAKAGEYHVTIPVKVKDLKVTLFTWNPGESKVWENPVNYLPATSKLPTVGDTVVVTKEMEINAASYNATILLKEANLRLRANAVTSGDVIMKSGTAISFATSGTGFSLDAKLKPEGEVTLKMSGSTEGNFLELKGSFEGNATVLAFNNTNAENVISKAILSEDNSLFTGTWTTAASRVASSSAAFEGASRNAFGNGNIIITAGNKIYFSHENATNNNELTLEDGAKATLNKNVKVGKLTLGGVEYTSGTFKASTHPDFFEGTGTLTINNTTSALPTTNHDNEHIIYFDGNFISSLIDMKNVKIYNLMGMLVANINETSRLIDLPELNGMYIIEVQFVDNCKKVQKIKL